MLDVSPRAPSPVDEVPHTLDEPVPRTLGLLDQLGLWGNLGVSLLGFTGAVAVLHPGGPDAPPLSLLAALLATVVGTALGSAAIAATAALGARTGAPSMVLLRGLFGVRGSAVPTVLNVVQMLGWGTFEIVTIGSALTQVVPGVPRWTWVVAVGTVTTLLALRPLGWVRVLRRYVSVLVVLALGYLLLAVPAPASSAGGWSGFSTAVDTALAVAVSWVPMAADYARHSRSTRAAALGAFVGYGVLQVSCYAVGLVAAASGDVFAVFLAVPLGVVAFLVLVGRELDQSFANVYSTTVSVQNLRPHWDRRVLSTVVGVVTTGLALFVHMDDYAGFLLLIGSVFVPLTGVLLTDRVCLRGAGWDLSPTAAARPLMLLPWALGIAAYHLVPAWASASLVSFLVAAAATAAVHVLPQTRPTQEVSR